MLEKLLNYAFKGIIDSCDLYRPKLAPNLCHCLSEEQFIRLYWSEIDD
jgi:hypothetical protein